MIELAEATIHIEAPQQRVFELFTTEAGLCSWMAKEAAVDLRPGGKWRWVHDNDVAASGEYVEVDPHDRVTFTYGWESGVYADMGPGTTRVEVTFVPTATGTRVEVAHGAVPEAFRDAHAGGWTYFLGLLADVAGGTAIPEVRLPAGADDRTGAG
ncbi:MAG: SRPBCC domain-containing protein [Actinomycetota bacterium]